MAGSDNCTDDLKEHNDLMKELWRCQSVKEMHAVEKTLDAMGDLMKSSLGNFRPPHRPQRKLERTDREAYQLLAISVCLQHFNSPRPF
jgi:hypothetical protein